MTTTDTFPSITEIATTIEEMVNKIPSNDPFSTEATLFGCDEDGAYILASGDNPYDVLADTPKPKQVIAVALLVSGWASPYDGDDEVRPSQHPERIRIRLVTAIGNDGMSTIMRRADKPNEIEDLGGDGTGALRDALEEWWGQ